LRVVYEADNQSPFLAQIKLHHIVPCRIITKGTFHQRRSNLGSAEPGSTFIVGAATGPRLWNSLPGLCVNPRHSQPSKDN